MSQKSKIFGNLKTAFSSKKLAFILTFLLALPAVLAADLQQYPGFFHNDMITVVIPDNASGTDVASMSTLANALQNAGYSVTAKTASQVNGTAGMNIVSIGKTNNAVSAQILGNDSTIVQNSFARITYFESGSAEQVVVYGNTPEDTQKGVYALANWQSFPLKNTEVYVSGIIPNLNLSRMVPYIDYTCGGNQTYQYGQQWPQPCVGQTLLQYYPSLTSNGNGQGGGTGNGGNGNGGNGNQTGGNQTGGSGNQTGGNQTVTPGASFTLSAITLGDDDQDRGENVSTTFTLQNTGTVTLNSFTFSGIDSKYQLNLTGIPSSLTSGQSTTVTINTFVPYDLDGVDSDCDENPVSIGTLTASTAQGATASQTVRMQATNELAILDVFTVIAGEKRKVLETKLIDIYREDDVEILVELKNKFDTDNKEGQDQSIEVEVKATGDTDELDLDDSNEVEIDAESEDEVSLDGTVEDDAKGSMRLILTAEGEDEKGAKHCDQTIVKFNVIEGVRSAIRLAQNATKQPTFIPLQEEQQTPPAAPQPEPREESVDVLTPTAPVTRSTFRDSTGYVALLVGMITLMLAVIGAETAFIMRKRKHAPLL